MNQGSADDDLAGREGVLIKAKFKLALPQYPRQQKPGKCSIAL